MRQEAKFFVLAVGVMLMDASAAAQQFRSGFRDFLGDVRNLFGGFDSARTCSESILIRCFTSIWF